MARPPKYATDHDKPISVTMRFPRALYDQAQHHAQRRQTTLTELVLEGVQLRLDTPTDPRDILVSQDNTVMQELRQMVADEVQAALAARHAQAPESTATRQRVDKSKTQHYGNPTQEQTYAAVPGHSLVSVPEQDPAPGRKGGRPRTARGQQILDLLAQHPEGLSVEQIRGALTPGKPLGDTLGGMRRTGAVRTTGTGKQLRYFSASESA